jgi:hypothetical protein
MDRTAPQSSPFPPVANPFSWRRSLRNNAIPPKRGSAEHERVMCWLLSHAWRGVAGLVRDPFDLQRHPVGWAIRLQSVREAQALLEARGWSLTGGSLYGDRAWWFPVPFELSKGNTRRSVGGALSLEGLLDQPPPALPTLISRPPLVRVVYREPIADWTP